MFEQSDALFERLLVDWRFSPGSSELERPTSADVELFARLAFRDNHLQKLCDRLEGADATDSLWRFSTIKLFQQINVIITHLIATGTATPLWTRLALKEGSATIDEMSNEAEVLSG